jgi:hypothetical protein
VAVVGSSKHGPILAWLIALAPCHAAATTTQTNAARGIGIKILLMDFWRGFALR